MLKNKHFLWFLSKKFGDSEEMLYLCTRKMNLKQFKILIDSLYDKFGGDIQVFRKNGNSRENPVIAAEVVKGESRGISKKDSSILLIE